jgi:hypothetical protein
LLHSLVPLIANFQHARERKNLTIYKPIFDDANALNGKVKKRVLAWEISDAHRGAAEEGLLSNDKA